jgi:outer membrane protein
MKFFLNVALMFFLFSAGSAHCEVVVGIINLQKVLGTIKESKSVNEKLKKSFDEKKALLAKEEDKIKKQQEEYVKQAALLSADAKSKKELAFNQAVAGLKKKTEEYQKEIVELETSLKKPILDKIKGVIESVSEEQKVDFTVEISASPVVYAKSKKDITDLVILEYDKKNK